MEYGRVKGVDKPVSRLVQGAMVLRPDKAEAGFALLDAVFAAGCNTFDAAHLYGGGACERLLGQWIEERGLREQVVILTKAAHHNVDRKRVTPFDIAADLHDSLARLRTEYIDLYLLHRDDPAVPVGPIVEVLNEYHAAGRIRVFGGSNWTTERLQKANEYAHAHGLTPFAASSPNFSLAEQVEAPWADCITISGPQNAAARAWYAQQRLPLFTWSSLARGFFSGRLTRQNFEEVKASLDSSTVRAYCSAPNFQRLDRAGELACEKGRSVPQVALAYVLQQPLEIFALVGCETPEEFRANTEALELKLSQAEMDWLDLRRDHR
ncbi:MAG: aldo/keto reductase [Candidatus Latescibacteria bacterium]|nr:aldo/keto reductase [Candidatus Latescibacterota bacterium]